MMSFRRSIDVREGISLAGLLTNVSPQNLTKPDIHRRVMMTNDDIFAALSGVQILRNHKIFSSFATSTREEGFSNINTQGGNIFPISPLDAGGLCQSTRVREGEFSDSIKKGLPTIANPVYGYSAPAKSGAGIGVLVMIKATHDAPSVFFCAVNPTHDFFSDAVIIRAAHKIMVGWMGASSEAPVSLIAGYANPVQSTTSKIGVFGGGVKTTIKEAAFMATIPTQNPQFIWLIAAVRRDMPTITAKIHHIVAETEREARRTLARDHVCFFAGRIRLEVAA